MGAGRALDTSPPDPYSRRYIRDLETAVPRVGGIQADRRTRQNVEVSDPHLDVLGWAWVTTQMHMAPGRYRRMPGQPDKCAGCTLDLPIKKGERTGFEEVAACGGTAAGLGGVHETSVNRRYE